MNNKEKQIEEMAKTMLELPIIFSCKISVNCLQCNYFKQIGCQTKLVAEALYNAGYRKVNDDEVVLSISDVEEFRKDQAEVKFLKKQIQEETRKETARAVVTLAYQLSNQCLDFYEFQNKLFDLIKEMYGTEVEKQAIVPAYKKYEGRINERKETAREILQELYEEADRYVNETVELNTFQIKELAEKYGVEVE